MTKGLFYKIDARKDQANPIIEHNIPEDMIVNADDFEFKRFETGSWCRYTYAYINQETFDSIFVHKLIFPTEYCSMYGLKYLGSAIVRSENGDILTFFNKDYQNRIILRPCRYFRNKDAEWGYRYEKYTKLPSRNIKVFLSRDEFEKDAQEKKDKHQAKREEDRNIHKEVTKTAPVFSFTTPKFKVVEVVKKTDWLSGVKIGDIIYGEIPVIKGNDDRKFGAMHGIGTLTNWVTIYINGEKSKIISPTVFPQLFFKNIIVEEVK